MRSPETDVLASSPATARAAARLLATRARGMLSDAEEVLRAAGETRIAETAYAAGEATTNLLRETHDGPPQVFACKR